MLKQNLRIGSYFNGTGQCNPIFEASINVNTMFLVISSMTNLKLAYNRQILLQKVFYH